MWLSFVGSGRWRMRGRRSVEVTYIGKKSYRSVFSVSSGDPHTQVSEQRPAQPTEGLAHVRDLPVACALDFGVGGLVIFF